MTIVFILQSHCFVKPWAAVPEVYDRFEGVFATREEAQEAAGDESIPATDWWYPVGEHFWRTSPYAVRWWSIEEWEIH